MTAHAIVLAVEGPVATATLSRSPVNAIDEAWLARLDEILAGLECSEGATVLHLRSAERVFCAGADLALMRSRFGSAEGRSAMVAYVREIHRVFARLERLPLVTLAEIGGAALGGGLELTLACDLRIASNEAQLGLPEARLGLLPGGGGTQRLARIAGEAAAKRLILGAEVVSGAQAASLGIVQWAVPQEQLAARARAIAAAVGELPREALAFCKRCIASPGAAGFEMEVQGTASLLASDGTQRRVRAFLEKR